MIAREGVGGWAREELPTHSRQERANGARTVCILLLRARRRKFTFTGSCGVSPYRSILRSLPKPLAFRSLACGFLGGCLGSLRVTPELLKTILVKPKKPRSALSPAPAQPAQRRTPPARLTGLAARLHARLSAHHPSPALERRRLPSPPAHAASQPRPPRLCACHDSLPIAQPAPPVPRASPHQRPASPSPRRTPRATPAPLSLMLGCRVARRASSRRAARLGRQPLRLFLS